MAQDMTERRGKASLLLEEGKTSMSFFVKGVELFENVSEEERQRISHLCADRYYRKRSTIYSTGDSSDALYIIKEGLVKLISVSEKGTEAILHILKANDVFGELFLAEERRPHTAVALTEVVVTVIPRANFVALLSAIPTVGLNFARLLSRRVVKVGRGLAEFSHSWSYHRLAKVFLELSEKHGEEVPVGTRITLRLTHEDLANLIGTTRETVTTQINRFERMGLLTRRDRQFIVNQPHLKEFIHLEEVRLAQP